MIAALTVLKWPTTTGKVKMVCEKDYPTSLGASMYDQTTWISTAANPLTAAGVTVKTYCDGGASALAAVASITAGLGAYTVM